jgi:asparagine synthetase B (glutamine-hydrolysing)
MVRAGLEARAEGCQVLLDGVGGDELMGGSSEYMADLLLAARPAYALSEAREWARAYGRPAHRVFARAALLPLISSGCRDTVGRLTGRPRLAVLPAWIDQTKLKVAGLGRALEQAPEPAAWQREERERRFWSFHLRDAVPALQWRERWAALPYSLEVRSPLYDLRVIEFAARLPSWVNWMGTRSKRLLRGAMRPRLPGEVVERSDKGLYTELLNRGVFEQERERVRIALEDSPLGQLPYVNREALLGEFEAFRRERQPRFYGTLRAISAGLWLRAQAVSMGRREALAV